MRREDFPASGSYLVLVTPAMARLWLTYMGANRFFNHHQANQIANDILNDFWEVNGDTIKFNENGELFDGQHRLHAIIRANRPVKTYVVFGLCERARSTSTGRNRSPSDVLAIEGFVNPSGVAAVLRLLHGARQGALGINRTHILSGPNALALAATYPELVTAGQRNSRFTPFGSKATGAFFCCMFKQINEFAGCRFEQILLRGDGPTDCGPMALRTGLLRDRERRSVNRLSQIERRAYYIKAWNRFNHNETVRRLRFGYSEQFPEIHGLDESGWLDRELKIGMLNTAPLELVGV